MGPNRPRSAGQKPRTCSGPPPLRHSDRRKDYPARTPWQTYPQSPPAMTQSGRSVRENVAHMKDFRGMKRQRSRNRKPSGNSNNPNRAYESNGPEGTKVRGNAQTIYEKYQQLARDANSSGDRVLAENHLQHAEHYFRLIRQMQPQRPVSEFVQRDPFSNGFDFDDEDLETEGNEVEAADAMAAGDDQPQGDEPRFDGQQNRDRRDRDNRDRNNGQQNRDRNDRDRNNRDRPERNNGERS